jgi:Protein of unknown function (DUF998)
MLRKALLACGILSSLVYVAANVLGTLAWPDYSSLSQSISELSAIGAPSRSTWVPLGIAYDVLLLAFGVGVWRAAEDKRRLRVIAALLVAIGVLGLFWPPMHLRGATISLTDTFHVVFAGVTSLLIVVTISFGATTLGRWFRRYSVATVVVLLGLGAGSFAYAPKVAADLPTPWLGLIERANLATYLVWVAALSARLLRPRNRCAVAQPRRKVGALTA